MQKVISTQKNQTEGDGGSLWAERLGSRVNAILPFGTVARTMRGPATIATIRPCLPSLAAFGRISIAEPMPRDGARFSIYMND